MDFKEFRKHGKEMIDYVADYLETIRDRQPMPSVQPGYLRQLIPDEAPEEPEAWEVVFKDIERVIMPGMTHWQNPQFHAYFPAQTSYPSIVADILCNGMNCIGFSWASSPACTELEIAVMDWLGKALQLPKQFLSGGKGCGVIQGTAGESALIGLLAARSRMVDNMKKVEPDLQRAVIYSKLVAYASDQAHAIVERACLLADVQCHQVVSDDKCSMRGQDLQKAIAEDKAKGLIPFYVVATLGTTSTCAFDKLDEIGPVCEKDGLWLHIDAAYAGPAFLCPEFRPLLNGVEYADTFNFNPHKWMLVHFDCSAMWFKDTSYMANPYHVNPLYLQHEMQDTVPDMRHYRIPMGHGFRALKLWFVMRLFGISGIQEYIRKHVGLAQEFAEKVKTDERFEITNKVTLGLVCFRLKGKSNDVNANFLKSIIMDGRIHLIPSQAKGIYFLRFVVCSPQTNSLDVKFAWNVIKELANTFEM